MYFHFRFLLLAIASITTLSPVWAETVIVHLRPNAQSLVLGTIDTADEAFKNATPVEAGSPWHRTKFFGSFAGFVERSALGPDGQLRIGAQVYLTPSTEGVKTTVIEPDDEITVNLVDRWVEITYRKSVDAYFRKPEAPAGTSVEPDFAVTVPRDEDSTGSAMVLPTEDAPEPDVATEDAPGPEVATEAQAETAPAEPEPVPAEAPREAPTPPDPGVLVLDGEEAPAGSDTVETGPGIPATATVATEPVEAEPAPAPTGTTAMILTPDPAPVTPVPTASAAILPGEEVAPVEEAPVVIEGTSVAGISEQELGRQPTLQPASGLTRRFDGRIREARWLFRRPPFRFELRDYNNDHIAYLDLSKTVISSFTDLKDSVVIVYGTIEGIGTSSKRVIRVQTLSRRR